ncbi:tetratricopeptide repeat protein [Scytonema sp. NUACC21]
MVQESRKLIVERINKFVDEFPTNKFVITSRIAGYRDVKLSSRFAEFTIEDMDSEQVERFLYRWCRTVEKAQQPDASEEQWLKKGTEQAQDILLAVKDNPGVQRLTANPLLLTILALIHRNGDRLPNRRVKLYELAVQTLTEDWQLGKKLPDAPRVVLKETEVVELLAPLAYWMHEEKPSGLVTQTEVEEKLAEKLAELNDTEPESDSVRQAVGEFLRKVRETTGLFVERMPGVYGFMHLTFEEYFAARYIADKEQSEILELIQKHLYEPRWNEPLLLALGYYGSHFSSQFKKLAEKLFIKLEDYQPSLQHGEIKIKSSASDNATIIYTQEDEATNNLREGKFKLRDLLFAGQVIAEIEINSIVIRKKPIHKLVITYLGIDADFEDDTTKQILKLLRKIELFYQKGEVIDLLKQAANDSTLSEEIRIKAKTAILYVACGGLTGLIDCVTEIVNQLEPLLFCSIRYLVQEMGDEMTPAFEYTRQHCRNDEDCQTALIFLTAMSYMRTDNYDKAIKIFEELNVSSDIIQSFVFWALAICYAEREEYEKSNDNFKKSRIVKFYQENNLLMFWKDWGWCHNLSETYEQSLELYLKVYNISKTIKKCRSEVTILSTIGKLYKEWGKYNQAINYHQESRELYQQLGKDENVANQWYWLGDCYREWGKYEQALECENQELALRQQLDDQVNIALAYWRLGRIYQSWGKYEQAINYYQQSRELYQQLGKDKDVANQWYWLGDCYREWGKYQQAIECANQELALRQQLDDQVNIALAYRRLGRIYQNWDQYKQAINYYQQSRELYQELGRDKNVADLWYWLGDCYREWGKYQQALECENQELAIRQQLDDQVNIALAYWRLGRIYKDWDQYEQAIDYYQQSCELYQQLGKDNDLARAYRQLVSCQCLSEKTTTNSTEISNLLAQAEENIRQAREINTTGEYQENLAYDYIALGLLYSQRLRLLSNENTSITENIALFEEYYHRGLNYLDKLGQIVNKADKSLEVARAYLEIEALENLNRSEEVARKCLQIFQGYNRRKLEASARKLLGEIYLKRTQRNQPSAETIAIQFLAESLQIYQDLDLEEKAVEVEELINNNKIINDKTQL